MYYLAQGDQFIIEYYHVSHFGTSPTAATWQIILFHNGNILLQYQNASFGDASYDNAADATVGIQMTSTVGLQYSYDSPALATERAICFAYPGRNADCSSGSSVPWLAEAPASGWAAGDSMATVAVTITALPTMTIGLYDAVLSVSTGDPGNPTVDVPVRLSIAPPGGWRKVLMLVIVKYP